MSPAGALYCCSTRTLSPSPRSTRHPDTPPRPRWTVSTQFEPISAPDNTQPPSTPMHTTELGTVFAPSPPRRACAESVGAARTAEALAAADVVLRSAGIMAYPFQGAWAQRAGGTDGIFARSYLPRRTSASTHMWKLLENKSPALDHHLGRTRGPWTIGPMDHRAPAGSGRLKELDGIICVRERDKTPAQQHAAGQPASSHPDAQEPKNAHTPRRAGVCMHRDRSPSPPSDGEPIE